MKRRLSGHEAERQWKVLLQQVPKKGNNTAISNKEINNNESNNNKDQERKSHDPFECQDIAVPPTHALVQSALADTTARWKALDDRKIARFKPPTRGPQSHLKLPLNFDYTGTMPPLAEDDEDRVVSLIDPSKRLSYASELHKLFASVPTAEQLERDARSGSRLSHTTKLYKEMQEGKLQHGNDGRSIARLRRSDRHGLPPPPPTGGPKTSSSKTITTTFLSTLRLECWKRQPKRGTSPDTGRMVLEFLASQTLLDVHRALVQLLEDDLWNAGDDGDDGCFFIENVFYTSSGKVDYATPILKWIDGGGPPNPTRRGHLGLSMKEIPINPMKDVVLGDLSLRLGIRYHHVCHGDVETAIMVTDKRLVPQASSSAKKQKQLHHCHYPLLHDIWTSPYALPFCDACRNHTAMYVTAPDCEMTDGGPRQLCEHCCNLLGLRKEQVQLYSIWRNEADLSTSAKAEDVGKS
jgi:hypothetical protein